MGLLAISTEKVLSWVRILVYDLRRVGLEVNHSKCELLILNHTREDALRTEGMFPEIMPGLKVVQRSEVTLLGAPLSGEGVSMLLSGKSEGRGWCLAELRVLVSALSTAANIKFQGDSLGGGGGELRCHVTSPSQLSSLRLSRRVRSL